jgi:hypothetical protein
MLCAERGKYRGLPSSSCGECIGSEKRRRQIGSVSGARSNGRPGSAQRDKISVLEVSRTHACPCPDHRAHTTSCAGPCLISIAVPSRGADWDHGKRRAEASVRLAQEEGGQSRAVDAAQVLIQRRSSGCRQTARPIHIWPHYDHRHRPPTQAPTEARPGCHDQSPPDRPAHATGQGVEAATGRSGGQGAGGRVLVADDPAAGRDLGAI